MRDPRIQGAGLGLRREHLPVLLDGKPAVIDFFEVAPENWLGVGGGQGRAFRALTERHPFVAHGLSLSLGGPDPLDVEFLRRIRRFLDLHGIGLYTEHLSYCSADGQLYELLPLPFTEEAVHHVAARIRQTQDLLGQRLAVENASYYVTAPGASMSEGEFLRAVLAEADCLLHLDVNNIYVNSVNHGFDAYAFLRGVPGERIAYIHTAGHEMLTQDLLIDTHGAAIIAPVWGLLEETYALFGVFPTLLERDFEIPPLAELLVEVAHISTLQRQAAHAGLGRVQRPEQLPGLGALS